MMEYEFDEKTKTLLKMGSSGVIVDENHPQSQ